MVGAPGERTPPILLERRHTAFEALGWIEGQNLVIERRYAHSRTELLAPLVEELIRLKVEVIVTEGTAATLAAKRATNTIPIVFWSAGDPVRSGLVASLARPGGNVTGFSLALPEVDTKLLSLLREILPTAQRVGVLENSTNPYFRAARKDTEEMHQSVGVHPIFVEAADAGGLEDAIANAARQRVQALNVGNDDLFSNNASAIMRAAAKYALPTMGNNELLEAGALLTYSINSEAVIRRRASFIDKILRGVNPGDLPVERPTHFEFGINLKTARTLGIAIPQSVLSRADKVIQ